MSWIPTAWLSLLPPQLIAFLLITCVPPTAMALLVYVAKRLTGLPKLTDSTAKKRWFHALMFADRVAGNSPTVESQLVIMQQRQALADQERTARVLSLGL